MPSAVLVALLLVPSKNTPMRIVQLFWLTGLFAFTSAEFDASVACLLEDGVAVPDSWLDPNPNGWLIFDPLTDWLDISVAPQAVLSPCLAAA